MKTDRTLNTFVRTRRTQVLALTVALLTLTVGFAGWRVRAGRFGLAVSQPFSKVANVAPLRKLLAAPAQLFGLRAATAVTPVAPPAAMFTTYVPNTFTDPVITTLNNATGEINGGTTISLRSALMAADNSGGTHTVTLSTGTYNLSKAPKSQIVIGNTSQNITINGNGPANTIINMVNDANRDRILLINPAGTTNSPVISISGITFQNALATSDNSGGSAIYAGGGSAESLTLTNCAFVNNVTQAGGGGGAAVQLGVID